MTHAHWPPTQGSLSSITSIGLIDEITVLNDILGGIINKCASVEVVDRLISTEQATHDNLNCNANLQISNTDVSISNAIPIKHGSPSALTYAHSNTTVGTSSVSIIASSASRRYLFIQNDSANVVWIKVGGVAVANQGIRITPRGGYFEMSRGAGNISTAQVFAIASAASSEVLVTQGA